ncbi:hypothetical protein IHE44_0012966 [Lamprotornis superbus]|uniref:Replication factor C subunit 1 n=1 Tax=Lamprotornis superbus TaxID=245042 RepID=A0A835NT34_9PASS|nr:hypothetical protein IHE44_0012966 [Lamprotornis superbus]
MTCTWCSAMDIRKFFGVVPPGKRQEHETVKKSEKIKNGGGPSNSEEELQSVKKSKKSPEKKAATSKLGKVLKQDPVVYISETELEFRVPEVMEFSLCLDEDDDFASERISLKPKENGTSVVGCPGTNTVKKEVVKPQAKVKPLSPVKQTPTSALDFFGTRSVQRSEKKLVASKRKEPSQSRDSTLDDEAIARQLQLEEDSELERQLHEDEEFARTLAMLDETPQKKKARKDTGEQTVLSINSSPNTTAGYKQSERVKATDSSDAAKNYSAKSQTKSEQLKGSCVSPQSSDGKKEEIAEKERGAQNSLSREKAASGKEEKTTPKKEKVSPKKTESISPEDSEKKRNNYQAYRSFLNREGPKALGSKEIPQGAENCLEGLTFVITGVLECIERDEAKSLIERYGGKVTGNVSKKTNYLVMGRDCGQSKCEKASTFGTKVIDEDGLFDLIRTMPGKKSKYELAAETEAKKVESKPKKTPQKAEAGKRNFSPYKKEANNKKYKSTPEKGDTIRSVKKETTAVRKLTDFKRQTVEEKEASKPMGNLVSEVNEDGTERLLWELGYSYVELNASDTRSKNSLKEVVAESLNNTSIKDFCSGASSSVSGKHVLIMDEVDGMAGNEDRGGIQVKLLLSDVTNMFKLQELIALIRHTKIPIICMCNDRNHPKMRSLVHYCLDLRFQRPRLEQIKGAMMSIAYKEGLKIPPPAMQEIILAANQDIRQVLHNLNMWCAKDKSLTYDEAKTDASRAKKDIKLGPFDVVRKVFATGEETARMSLIDKSDLFFHDYSLAPLFVQENYVHVKPAAAGGNLKKHLVLLSRAADSICDGDIVDRQIRSKQNWNLLPTQAIYASVLPGELMRGYMSQFPVFPSWLGKFSSTGKHDRIIQELAMHMSLSPVRENCQTWSASCAAPQVSSYCTAVTGTLTWYKVKAAFTRAYNKEAHLTPYSLSSVKASKRQSGSAATLDLSEDLNVEEIQSDEDEQDTLDSDAMIKVYFQGEGVVHKLLIATSPSQHYQMFYKHVLQNPPPYDVSKLCPAHSNKTDHSEACKSPMLQKTYRRENLAIMTYIPTCPKIKQHLLSTKRLSGLLKSATGSYPFFWVNVN